MAGHLLNQPIVMNVFVIAGMLGAVFAYYRHSTAAGWRDVAEQRMAAIEDRDRQLSEQRGVIDTMHSEIAAMRAEISHLKGELAEMKRHDMSSVIGMIEKLAIVTDQVRVTNSERERENAILFSDLRTHVFPMIEEMHRKLKEA